MAAQLTAADFAPRIGEPFAIVADRAEGFELELVEVRGLGQAFQEREAFALVFRGPADPVLAQATYRLANRELGELDVFIVPVGQPGGGTDYEAIFT